MDLSFSTKEEAFRAEVQAFIRGNLRPELAAKMKRGDSPTKAELEEWHALLNAQGWLANHWPVEHGGPGWGPVARHSPETVPDRNLGASVVAALLASGIVYLTLPAVGLLIFGEYGRAAACLLGAGACAVGVFAALRRVGWAELVR